MGYSVILFLMILFTTVFSIYILVDSIREMRRFGELKGYTRFIIAGVICIIFIYCNPPHWNSMLDLNDSQITTGVLKYQDGNFKLIGSGDDSQDWDFSHCEIDSMLKLHCKDKEITVWHNDHVVYQVEKNGKIIYSIGNSNRRIILDNLDHIMIYILVCAFILRVVTNCDLRLKDLLEEEERKEFEDRFITEEEVKPFSKIATMSDEIDNDTKIVRRFCKNCGAELGKIIEITENSSGRKRLKYDQYKFCANCGLASDPNMSVKAKPKDDETVKFLIALFLFMSGLIAPVLVVMIASGGIDILLACLGIMVAISFIVWLFSEKIHDCPSCGRLYTKEHFCPNCGTYLKKD